MKKKILGGFAVLSIAAFAAFNLTFGVKNNDLSAVSLANVEALAQETTPCTEFVCYFSCCFTKIEECQALVPASCCSYNITVNMWC